MACACSPPNIAASPEGPLRFNVSTQAFVNVLVNLQLFPSKGLTLPLVSYGGSSTIAVCLGVGLLPDPEECLARLRARAPRAEPFAPNTERPAPRWHGHHAPGADLERLGTEFRERAQVLDHRVGRVDLECSLNFAPPHFDVSTLRMRGGDRDRVLDGRRCVWELRVVSLHRHRRC